MPCRVVDTGLNWQTDSLSIAAQAALNRLGIEAISQEQAIPRIRREVNSYLNDERRLLRNSDDLVSCGVGDAKAKEPVATWVPQNVFSSHPRGNSYLRT